MKKIDCPLCGSKDVITYTNPELVTDVKPVHVVSGDIHVGNYEQRYQGGGYDWSHAHVCPNLEGTFDKVGLLQFHTLGQPEVLRSDLHSIEDYESAIWKQLSLSLRIGIGRRKGDLDNMEWFYNAHLSNGATEIPQLETIAKDPDSAFNLLRHRILCGEIVRGYQLYNSAELTFIKM
ncbi:MAG: hypothetical protein KBB91_01360 [Candidatus Pacebacteria bacterium]|nr:hypothetical protein [Candidatus Paceibacterota bacterium]MBP9701138.1 hypothetical protein [Candidatus Paceibacterota bacterium]